VKEGIGKESVPAKRDAAFLLFQAQGRFDDDPCEPEVKPMRWKQFFTPVESLDAGQAKSFMANLTSTEFTLLDVRQPSEYAESHIPGARLIPLPDLTDRLGEMDPAKPVLVY
jgi:3-mercaptopyruvate sulfurtransferase SseA